MEQGADQLLEPLIAQSEKSSVVYSDYDYQKHATLAENKAPELVLDHQDWQDARRRVDKENLILDELEQNATLNVEDQPLETIQQSTAAHVQKQRDSMERQRPPTNLDPKPEDQYNQEVQDKLREAFEAYFSRQKLQIPLPGDFVELLEALEEKVVNKTKQGKKVRKMYKGKSEDINRKSSELRPNRKYDTSQIEIYPNPAEHNSAFVVLTICKFTEKLTHHIYKIWFRSLEKIEMKSIGEFILANSSRPYVAYHQKLHPTSQGLLFFQVEAEGDNGKKGPYRIFVKIFLYKTGKIQTLKEFGCDSKLDQSFCSIYMFGQMETQTIACDNIRHLREILDDKFLLLSMRDTGNHEKVQVIKLSKPEEILYEGPTPPNANWQPIVLDISQNDAKRNLFWRGVEDKDVLLQVNPDGSVQVNVNNQLKDQFKEETNHMAKHVWKINGGDEGWRNHLCVEKGKSSVSKTNLDFSNFETGNAKFAQALLFECKVFKVGQKIAVLLRKDSMLIIDIHQRMLHSIQFGNKQIIQLKDITEKLPPLNSLQLDYHPHVIPSQFRNFVVSSHGEFQINHYFPDLKEWKSFETTNKKLLAPFIRNTFQQSWRSSSTCIDGVYWCVRGGILGTHCDIEEMHDDVACLVSEEEHAVECQEQQGRNILHQNGMESPKIKVGTKADLKKALLVEFPKHQKPSKNEEPTPFPCIAIHTKQSGILLDTDEWAGKDIDVEGITLIMLCKDHGPNFEILAQYPIPLEHQHKLKGLISFAWRKHSQWDLIQVSDWIREEQDKKWLVQMDLAFCEYSVQQQILQIRILRFQSEYSEGQDHTNSKLFQVGTKLILSQQPLTIGSLTLQPRFDEMNRIKGCQLRRKLKREEQANYYLFKNPNEEKTIFQNMLTNQDYTIFGDYGNPQLLLIEIEFTRLFAKNENLFSERRKRDILFQFVAIILDMVPNHWPQAINQKTRNFSNYECLYACKPYELNTYTPSGFKAILDQHKSGHKTIIEIFDSDNFFKKALNKLNLDVDSQDPLLKRNMDGQTLVRTFYNRENPQMVKVLSKILLESLQCKAARDVIMSDLFEMFESSDMLTCFQKLFMQDDADQDHDEDESQCQDPSVKFQMQDQLCSFLTTGSDEQVLQCHDSNDFNLTPGQFFHHSCTIYDRFENTNQFSIQPFLIDLEKPEQTQIFEWLQNGGTLKRIHNFQIAKWMDLIVNLFADKIDSMKFTREWNEMMFERVKMFYYVQFALYLVYAIAQFWLLLELEQGERNWTWEFYASFSILVMQTLFFIVVEAIQLAYERENYFEGSNILESFQIILNLILISLLLSECGHNIRVLGLTMICLTMYKLLIQLLVFESLGMLVLLIFQCLKDTVPFIIYLFIWLEFFIALYRILGVRIGSPVDGIEVNLSDFIKMFRSSVGDLQEPEPHSEWKSFNDGQFTWVLSAIWVTYVCMIYLETVILNNFLIAKVSSVYENFQMTFTLSRNMNQIQLIREYLMLQDFLSKFGLCEMPTLNMLIMYERDESEGEGDVWQGTVLSIKKHITSQIMDLKNKLYSKVATKDEITVATTKIQVEIQEVTTQVNTTKDEITEAVKGEVEAVNTKIEAVNAKVEAVRDEMATVSSNISEILKLLAEK